MAVKPIPDGFHTVTPHIVVDNASEAIDFYKKAFNAEEIMSMPAPDGKIMHALIKIGDSFVMLNDEFPDMGAKGPKSIGGTGVTLSLYVEEVDKVFERAANAGAEVVMPVADQFWGDRYGMLKDPYGHQWAVATHKSDLTHEQILEAAAKQFGAGSC
ncbi:MAG: VOC family protein [Candidatus Krumholzibacteriia bacterium]